MEEDIVRISELPGANPLAGPELVPLVQDGVTKTRSAVDVVLDGGLQDHLDAADPHNQYAFRVKNNLEATTNPTVNDDINEGYTPTSRWVNTVTEEFYICVTNTAGSANWQTLTLTLDELGSAALADVGSGNGLDADLLDAQQGTYYLDFPNFTNLPDPVLTLAGDVSGTATLTNLGDATLTVTVDDNSHDHTITNVTGLQDALDEKIDSVNGKEGDVVLVTDDISEDGAPLNLWFTNTRARNAISASGDVSYNPTTGVISYSETYSTPSELLTAIKTVDGAGSGLDADLLDGNSSAFFRNAGNLNAGTVPDARLPDTITSSITGNAATATTLATARSIALGGDLSGSTSFNGSSNVTINAVVADDSHNHIISNVDGLQTELDSKLDQTSFDDFKSREELLKEATFTADFTNNTYVYYDGPVNDRIQTTFKDVFNFTRGTKASARNATKGITEIAVDDHRLVGNREGLLIEEQRTNLLEGPRELANLDYWNQITDTIAIPNDAVSVDGKLKATTIKTGGGGADRIRRNLTASNSTEYTFSVFFKKNQSTLAELRLRGDVVTDGFLIFDTSDGSIFTSGGDDFGLIEYAEYWRAYVVATTNGTGVECRIEMNDGIDQTVDWAVLEEGSFPTSVIVPDTTFTSRSSTATYLDSDGVIQTASVDEARDNAYGYDSDGVLRSIGLLLEGAATNELLWNRDLSDAVWTGAATISKNAVGLDGVANSAHTITDDDGAAQENKTQTITVANDAATHAAYYFIGKDSDTSRFPLIVLSLSGGDNLAQQVVFNTSSGVVEGFRFSDGTVKVEDFGDFWKLTLTITNNFSGNTSLAYSIFPAINSDGSSNIDPAATGSVIYDFGGVELNSTFVTSPIETAGSTVTRSADVSSSPAATREADACSRTLGAEYNASESTIFCDFTSLGESSAGTRGVFVLTDGTTSVRLLEIDYTISGDIRVLTVGSLDSAILTFSADITTRQKVAASYDGSTLIAAVNGVSQSVSVTSGAVATLAEVGTFGQDVARNMNGTVKDARIIPRALTASELETLTGGN